MILYTSDHGSHFKTRNAEYKRCCHESAVRTPLIIRGGGFIGGKKEQRLTSLIDLPPTLLSLASIPVPDSYMGEDLTKQLVDPDRKRDCVFIQISESQCGRAIRTERFKYSVRSAAASGFAVHSARVYFEDYLYDLERDPDEKENLVKDPQYKEYRSELRKKLIEQMVKAGEKAPVILPAIRKREK